MGLIPYLAWEYTEICFISSGVSAVEWLAEEIHARVRGNKITYTTACSNTIHSL